MAGLRILLQIDFPSDETFRFWDGAGPYVDTDGNIWLGGEIGQTLDRIETARNGEASTLTISLANITRSDVAFEDLHNNRIIGAEVQLFVQDLDDDDAPLDDPDVVFTGTIADMSFDDVASAEGIVEGLTIVISNRFDLRAMNSGEVLSDTNQKARSARINPGAIADQFLNRITGLLDRSIHWPLVT